MKSVLTFFFRCLLSVFVAVPVSATTLDELNARYDQAARAEADLLEQISEVQRNVQDSSLILIGKPGGHVQGYNHDQLATLFGRVIDRAQVLGIDDAYLSRLSAFDAGLARIAIATGLVRDTAIARLARDTETLRAAEKDKLDWLQQELIAIRIIAGNLQAERERMREFTDTGQMPADSPTATNAVCTDYDVPVDSWAIYWKSGYGGSSKFAVKGQIICRNWNWFHYLTGSQLWQFNCDQNGNCARDPDYAMTYVKDKNNEGIPMLKLEDGGTITLYPDED